MQNPSNPSCIGGNSFDEPAVAGVFQLLIVFGRAAVAGEFLLWISFSTPTVAEVVYFVLPLRVVSMSFIFLVIFIPRRERLNTSVADVEVRVVVLSAAVADQCRIRLASTLRCVFVVANLVAEHWAISYSSVMDDIMFRASAIAEGSALLVTRPRYPSTLDVWFSFVRYM